MIPPDYAARKLPLEFDGARLAEDLDRVLDDEWIPHPYTEQGGVLFKGGTYYVAVLFSDNGATQNIMPRLPVRLESRESPVLPTPLLERCPYFREALGRFDCEFNIVRLLAMDPGIAVKKHIDKVRTTNYQIARIHIPVVTNPKAKFVIHGQRIQPQVGECWYVDAAVPHSLRNDGAARRVHIVMDCVVSDFVNELVGFDIAEFRRSQAQEYRRLWKQFERQLNRRRQLHQWNTRIKTVTHRVVERSRQIARGVLPPSQGN